jgi:hypothetical protein
MRRLSEKKPRRQLTLSRARNVVMSVSARQSLPQGTRLSVTNFRITRLERQWQLVQHSSLIHANNGGSKLGQLSETNEANSLWSPRPAPSTTRRSWVRSGYFW